jgi:hypothetical protein
MRLLLLVVKQQVPDFIPRCHSVLIIIEEGKSASPDYFSLTTVKDATRVYSHVEKLEFGESISHEFFVFEVGYA